MFCLSHVSGPIFILQKVKLLAEAVNLLNSSVSTRVELNKISVGATGYCFDPLLYQCQYHCTEKLFLMFQLLYQPIRYFLCSNSCTNPLLYQCQYHCTEKLFLMFQLLYQFRWDIKEPHPSHPLHCPACKISLSTLMILM